MLVKCDQCSQSYQVNESRLPSQGARIKCPSCGNVFLIKPPSAEETGTSQLAKTLEVPKIESAGAPKSAGVPKDDTPWKICHAGLTYTFYGVDNLRDWLAQRATLAGVKIAHNNEQWHEFGDYPEVLTTELITKFFPLGDVPKSSDSSLGSVESRDMSNTLPAASSTPVANVVSDFSVSMASVGTVKSIKQARRERQKSAQGGHGKAIGAAIFCIACVGVLVAVLTGYDPFASGTDNRQAGMVDGEEYLVEDVPAVQGVHEGTPGVEPFAGTSAPVPVQISEEEAAALAHENVQRNLDTAREMIKNRRWPEARVVLESLLKESPNEIEAMQMLARVYRELSLRDLAGTMEASIVRLRGAQKAVN
ncbi:MAG: zinc-ribbon domain-containing protein [Proteobacteria bacterium]|nr:zinc-ribbon domain-containing protein [Pseudomonadota bacterium]